MRQIRKQRRQKTSIWFFCEGKTEVAFLQYIKNLGFLEGKNHIRIRSVDNGSLSYIKKFIERQKHHVQIDRAYTLTDEDRATEQEVKNMNGTAEPCIADPCIEGFFLEILTGSKPQTSKECKKNSKKSI